MKQTFSLGCSPGLCKGLIIQCDVLTWGDHCSCKLLCSLFLATAACTIARVNKIILSMDKYFICMLEHLKSVFSSPPKVKINTGKLKERKKSESLSQTISELRLEAALWLFWQSFLSGHCKFKCCCFMWRIHAAGKKED